MRTTPTERMFLQGLKNLRKLGDAHREGCSAEPCGYCLALRHVGLALAAPALDDAAGLVRQSSGAAADELEKLDVAVRDLIHQKGLD